MRLLFELPTFRIGKPALLTVSDTMFGVKQVEEASGTERQYMSYGGFPRGVKISSV